MFRFSFFKTSLILFLTSFFAQAFAISIPSSLSSNDRSKILNQLTAPLGLKSLGGSYSLGGHSGFEVGIISQAIATNFLDKLGSGTSNSKNLLYNSLSIGKGLYNDVDLHLVFSPWSGATATNSFGGQISWSFAQAKTLPAHLSAVVSANTVRILDSINATNINYDLLFGFYVGPVNVFAGFGVVRSWGAFSKKLNSSNHSEELATESVQSGFGATYNWQNYFFSSQISQISESSFQFQLGYVF